MVSIALECTFLLLDLFWFLRILLHLLSLDSICSLKVVSQHLLCLWTHRHTSTQMHMMMMSMLRDAISCKQISQPQITQDWGQGMTAHKQAQHLCSSSIARCRKTFLEGESNTAGVHKAGRVANQLWGTIDLLQKDVIAVGEGWGIGNVQHHAHSYEE